MPAPDVRRWLTAVAGAALALFAFALVAPHAPSAWPLAAGVIAFACVSSEVLVASALTPRLPPGALFLALIPVGALVGVALAGSAVTELAASMIVTLALLAVGTLTGGVVGNAIDKPGYLIVVAAVSALVDIFSVLHPNGPTAQLVQIEIATNVLILPWPILGTARIDPVLGVGDIAFAAIYAVATKRHGLPMARTVAALAIGLSVTLAAVVATGVGIPALPFLGAAVVIAHPAARAVPREDRKRAFYGLVILVLAFAVLFVLR